MLNTYRGLAWRRCLFGHSPPDSRY